MKSSGEVRLAAALSMVLKGITPLPARLTPAPVLGVHTFKHGLLKWGFMCQQGPDVPASSR